MGPWLGVGWHSPGGSAEQQRFLSARTGSGHGLHEAAVLFPPLSKMISCPYSGLQERTVIHLDSTWTLSHVNALQLLSSNSGVHPFWSYKSCRLFKGRADAHGPASLLPSDFLTGLTVHSVHKSFMQIRTAYSKDVQDEE